jgi:fructosamine-3-kinase
MTECRDVIAVVDAADRSLVRLLGEDGLPTLVGDGWPSVPDIAAFVGGSGLLPLSPAVRLSDEPRVVLRVLTAGSATVGEWRRLEEAGEHAGAVARFVDEWTGRQSRPAGRPDWYRIGWLAEIDNWIDAVLAVAGRRRSAPTEVVQMWSLSAVLKVAYDGEVAYVKASCEHFRAEARITEVIAGWPAGAVPDVLAAEADRGWLMMAPLPESVDSVDVADSVVAAAESLALLQLQSVPRHRELPDCPDRTLAKTWTAFAPLVDTSLERDELSAAETAAVRSALAQLASVVEELDGCGLPSVLTHGDLHRGNVAWDGRNVVLFDWSDSCWSHPILDIYHLTAHVPDDVRARAVDAYQQVWRAAFPDAEIERALELAPTVDLMFQAVSYEGLVRAVEPMSRWEIGGMVARNLRRLARAPSARG